MNAAALEVTPAAASSGVQDVVYFAALILLLGVSVFLLWRLPWPRPGVLHALPGWRSGLVLVAAACWLCSQFLALAAGAAVHALYGLPASGVLFFGEAWNMIVEPLELLVALGTSCVTGIACVGVLLALPRIFGVPSPVALGIGTEPAWRGIVQGTLAMPAVIPGVLAAAWAWTRYLESWEIEAPKQDALRAFEGALDTGAFEISIAIAFAAVVCAPLLEEILFRGIIFRVLERQAGLASALVLSGLFFAAVHFSLHAFLPLWALGIALAYLYYRTGSLWPCIVLHAVFNSAQLTLTYVVARNL